MVAPFSSSSKGSRTDHNYSPPVLRNGLHYWKLFFDCGNLQFGQNHLNLTNFREIRIANFCHLYDARDRTSQKGYLKCSPHLAFIGNWTSDARCCAEICSFLVFNEHLHSFYESQPTSLLLGNAWGWAISVTSFRKMFQCPWKSASPLPFRINFSKLKSLCLYLYSLLGIKVGWKWQAKAREEILVFLLRCVA